MEGRRTAITFLPMPFHWHMEQLPTSPWRVKRHKFDNSGKETKGGTSQGNYTGETRTDGMPACWPIVWLYLGNPQAIAFKHLPMKGSNNSTQLD
ncbi:hypothetical protein HPB48_001388 [Haemaphysalis longicornis]|uniref:Uncharacterized protein n=1 Tax=Haemaphysalis longicornis TaxID=44386 RepID=A0A9J6GYV9_HAELO|nr:hypothetical protein HPB48_001388 [Haemaphysalis longicornis]